MSSDKTSLGDRMKGQYESRTQTHLPRRTYTIIRLDGKAFHTYTRGCDKPYDLELSVAMTDTDSPSWKTLFGNTTGAIRST